jgi:glutamyl-tRNA synthetase
MNDKGVLCCRFAPSPTGYLHIGGARTCFFSWLYARGKGGKFILRIEDTDVERSKKEYLDEILESIRWLGMDWDEIFYQSRRFDLYREYARRLVDEKKAYNKEGAVFFRYEVSEIRIHDLIRGEIVFTELPKEEEVIIKSDGSPTYNFSCCLDDALMGVNCVIRGEDHISNTPKQILMYKALGFELPQFAHLPLILSPEGGRLSKRFGATSIREYTEEGYLAEALMNYLLLLGWSPGDNREIITLTEAMRLFDIQQVNKTGANFSLDKLNWVNFEYLQKKSDSELTDMMYDFLLSKEFLPPGTEKEYIAKLVPLFKERISRFSDLLQQARFCFYDDFQYGDEAREILENNLSREINCLIERLGSIEDFCKGEIEREFRETAADLGLKLKILVHPVRVALTGKKTGPGLFETIEVLGKDRVVARLRRLVDYWS